MSVLPHSAEKNLIYTNNFLQVMLLDLILIPLTLLVLIIASYCDLKIREVPDWLNYGFIFAVLGIRTIFSFQQGWNVLLAGVLGFGLFFLLAMLFYHSNQWGGGDSKLLMGMGAVIGISYPFNGSSAALLWFMISLLLFGSIYGLIWLIITAIINRDFFMKEARKKFKEKRIHLYWGISSFIFFTLGCLFNSFFFFGLFPAFIYYLLFFVDIIERICFVRSVGVAQLTEGDWLAKDVFVNGRKILKKKTLTKLDLALLKKKTDSVKIKEGIPFVPSFLFAYLFILFGNEMILWLIRNVFS